MALLSVAEALERVLAHAAPVPAEEARSPKPTAACSPTISRRGAPNRRPTSRPWTAMRCAPPTWRTRRRGSRSSARSPPGRPFAQTVGAGEAARIFTGGVVPAGADTVVIQEFTKRDGDWVEVQRPTAKGRHIRAQGLDFKAGDILLAAGHQAHRPRPGARRRDEPSARARASPAESGAVRDRRRTGAARHEPRPGQIVSSNRLCAGGARTRGRRRRRSISALSATGSTTRSRRSAARATAAPTFSSPRGGASVGDYDLVQTAFAAEGMALSFWKLALRPGRPLMHGRLGAMQVLGVPGNPVSAFVCALSVPGAADPPPCRPRRSRAADRNRRCSAATCPKTTSAPTICARRSQDDAEGPVATPFPVQDSSMMAPLAKADCLVIREPYSRRRRRPAAPARSCGWTL